jgi:hypothetical protein
VGALAQAPGFGRVGRLHASEQSKPALSASSAAIVLPAVCPRQVQQNSSACALDATISSPAMPAIPTLAIRAIFIPASLIVMQCFIKESVALGKTWARTG